jgi:APA family basic amino acid/polyamine antiporter
MVFGNIVSASAVALGFAGYLSSFMLVALVPVAVALICLSGVILIIGVKESVVLGVVFTGIEVAALVIALVVAAPFIGEVDYLEMPQGIGGVLQATTLVFFAYLGFEQIASLSEDAKHPTRSVPTAILLAVAVTTVLYMAVALAGVSVLGWEELSSSPAPLAEVVRQATGARVGAVVALMALFATANTVLFLLLTSSRVMYGMGNSGSLPKPVAAVHPKRRTPWVAILLAVGVAVIFALLGDIQAVAQLSNFAILAAFLVVNASLIRLRYTRPDLERPFRTPWSVGRMPIVPLLGIGTSLFMLAQIELQVLGYGVGIGLLGLAVSLLLPKVGLPRPVGTGPKHN